MSRVLVIHTPSQLEEASSLIDLLEASLPVPEGAIVCSSLPGYAWSPRAQSGGEASRFAELLDGLQAALALVDEPALRDPRLWFELAAVWSRGKRVAVLVADERLRSRLPSQLASATVIKRSDRVAMIALIEDLGFDLDMNPRLGHDAQHALAQFSSAPPPPSEPTQETPVVPIRAIMVDDYESIESVPAPPPDGVLDDDEYELADDEVEALPLDPDPEPRYSHIGQRASCEIAFEAGRSIGECAFHRDEGGDFAAELESPFGRFIDTVGGNWSELKRLGDLEVWLSAVDNLLESLPPELRHVSEWYEIGFQFSTLRSIAEEGLPPDMEQRAAYQEVWGQSMAQFRNSAASARIAGREIRRLQSLLENLIGAEAKRDYANLARALEELRAAAAEADRGELQVGQATG